MRKDHIRMASLTTKLEREISVLKVKKKKKKKKL
jgi:hypothetical protein